MSAVDNGPAVACLAISLSLHTLTKTSTQHMLQAGSKGMELRRTSDSGVPDQQTSSKSVPAAITRRLSEEEEDRISLGIVGKEVVTPQATGNGCRGLGSLGGPCAMSCLSGRAYTVYLIRVRQRGSPQYIVRRRFREFCSLNDCIVDEELRSLFPPRSLCAKAGLACALETRQGRLAYYVKELAHKLAQEPCKDKILAFLQATDCRTPAEPDAAATRPSFSHNDEKGERGSSEEVETAATTAIQPIGLSTIRLSSAGYEAETPKGRPSFAATAEQRAALARLLPIVINGITVIKHGRRGSPKLRLIFCNEDCSRIYWASDRHNSSKRSNLSSLALADVTEVREGTAPDPHHPGLYGTATLRRRRASSLAVPVIPGNTISNSPQLPPAPRAFSLIAAARSLDLEALSGADFILLVEGFRAAVSLNMATAAAAAAAAAASAVTAPAGGTKAAKKGNKAAPAFGV